MLTRHQEPLQVPPAQGPQPSNGPGPGAGAVGRDPRPRPGRAGLCRLCCHPAWAGIPVPPLPGRLPQAPLAAAQGSDTQALQRHGSPQLPARPRQLALWLLMVSLAVTSVTLFSPHMSLSLLLWRLSPGSKPSRGRTPVPISSAQEEPRGRGAGPSSGALLHPRMHTAHCSGGEGARALRAWRSSVGWGGAGSGRGGSGAPVHSP